MPDWLYCGVPLHILGFYIHTDLTSLNLWLQNTCHSNPVIQHLFFLTVWIISTELLYSKSLCFVTNAAGKTRGRTPQTGLSGADECWFSFSIKLAQSGDKLTAWPNYLTKWKYAEEHFQHTHIKFWIVDVSEFWMNWPSSLVPRPGSDVLDLGD